MEATKLKIQKENSLTWFCTRYCDFDKPVGAVACIWRQGEIGSLDVTEAIVRPYYIMKPLLDFKIKQQLNGVQSYQPHVTFY